MNTIIIIRDVVVGYCVVVEFIRFIYNGNAFYIIVDIITCYCIVVVVDIYRPYASLELNVLLTITLLSEYNVTPI